VYYAGSSLKILPFLQYGDMVIYNFLGIDNLVALPADNVQRFRHTYSPPCKTTLICKTTGLVGGSAHVWPCGIGEGANFATSELYAIAAPFSYALVATDYDGYINVRRNASVTSCQLSILGYYDRRVLE
jgi:hypothetical protein